MTGLFVFIGIAWLAICAVSAGKDVRNMTVPKCKVCYKPKAPNAPSCLHCGAH